MGERRSAVAQYAGPGLTVSVLQNCLSHGSSWHTPLVCALSYPECTSGLALVPEGSWPGVEACALRNPFLDLLSYPAFAFRSGWA